MSNLHDTVPDYPQVLRDAIFEYYKKYYLDQLGLPDWVERAERRLNEEENFGMPIVKKVADWMNLTFAEKKVLVVGAGTGAETFALHRLGAEVHAIEPDFAAVDILFQKATVHELATDHVKQGVAEILPFDDNQFDFVMCNTVLEHVADVAKSVSEMVRVCKIGGLVHIQTPEYRFPYEGHYKSARIAFSPKWMTILLFWLQGKPIRFLFSVNFVTAPSLDKLLMRHDVTVYRILLPYMDGGNSKQATRFFKFVRKFGFGKDQFIFLKKLSGRVSG